MPNSKQNPLLNYRTLTDEDRFLNQQNKINAKYDSQINNLNLGKTTQQQQADITRSQLQKYLPYYYKSKGLSGLGLEQSAMLDANANYTNQLGQIENNFAQQKNALENYRQNDLMKAENDYLANIDKNSMSAHDEVTFALQNYINDEKLTADEISKTQTLLDLYRDQMNQTDIKMAENLLENYKTQFGKAEAETNKNTPTINDEVSQNQLEGKSYIEYGGEKFVADKKINKADKKIVKNNNYVQKVMELNGFASAYDEKIPDGFVLVAYEDADGNNKNTYEIRDGKVVKTGEHKAFGINNSDYYSILGKKYYLYKNGQWYEMKKSN